MSARTNLVLKDRAGTPVNHTFTPDGDIVASGTHVYSEKTGVPAGNPKFTSVLKKDANGRFRPTLRLTVPVVQTQTINGVSAPVVVRTAYIEMNATFDGLSSSQERADAIGMFADSLLATQTQINDLLVNLSDTY